ncbi:MAG: GatB/YqeY domain-containing protein [Terricaulis sp.]
MSDAAETVRQRLQADLREAMKSRDKAKLDVLRALVSAIDNAGAVALDAPEVRDYTNFEGRSQYVVTGVGKTEVARKTLDAADIATLFRRDAAERRAAADDMARHGRMAEAEALRASAALVESYIP